MFGFFFSVFVFDDVTCWIPYSLPLLYRWPLTRRVGRSHTAGAPAFRQEAQERSLALPSIQTQIASADNPATLPILVRSGRLWPASIQNVP